MAVPSLAGRSIAAILLMVGFYLLALGMIAGLLFLPYAELTYAHRVHLKLAIVCIFGAGAIAWAILPRIDSFDAPGPELSPARHPDLFAKLTEIARRTGQEMPKEVYLVPEMNAWVANRGGVMGFGSRRVMGLGLPLMQVTTSGEFEAILAHEFGHYHGGDTRLGPWIYKTRGAIGRTLANLGDGSWLQLPFRWYGNFFLRITQAISRAQEYTADRLAATVVGAQALIDGLKKVHAYAEAFGTYWHQEAMPVLQAGFYAPLGDGFTRYLEAPRVGDGVRTALETSLESSPANPYDSHPPLAERIRAVEALVAQHAGSVADERPALALIGDLASSERELLAFLATDGNADRFTRVAWEEVTDKVFAPAWRRQAERMAPAIGTARLGDLAELLRSRGLELARATLGTREDIPAAYFAQVLTGPVGSCIATALIDAGWEANADLGQPVTVRRGDVTLEPFSVVHRLLAGGDAATDWKSLVADPQIAQLPLAAPSSNA